MIEEIVTIVQQLGFPIACVIAMYYELGKQREAHALEMTQTREAHKIEIEKMVDALNNNTVTMQKLVDKLDGIAK